MPDGFIIMDIGVMPAKTIRTARYSSACMTERALGRFDREAVVVEKNIVDDEHFTIVFRPHSPITFIPGQYVSVILDGMRPAPFSIANSAAQEDIELGIGVHGAVTTALRDTPLGTTVVLRGPFGRFTLGDEKKVCFLSGGVGITPFASMLRSLRDTEGTIDAVLLASAKHRAQLLWADELLALRPPLRAVLTLTQERDPALHHGRIDAAFIQAQVPDFAERTFYACGPAAFIDAVFAALARLGVPPERMRKEAW